MGQLNLNNIGNNCQQVTTTLSAHASFYCVPCVEAIVSQQQTTQFSLLAQ